MSISVRAAAALVLAGAFLILPAAPAQARAAACLRPPAPKATIKDVPYEDRLYDPARLARLATGTGIHVAVIDSGVDAGNPQLAGKVMKGADLLHGSDGTQDCVGHGTGVAGIIAAGARDGVGFVGLAPGVKIVPVRVSEYEDPGGDVTGDPGDPGTAHDLARAIRWAATTGDAQVINLSLTTSRDGSAEVCAAADDAYRRGVVLVAAAGNVAAGKKAPQDESEPFPAGCPHVIGVGAVGPDGTRSAFSRSGPWVDIVAAGYEITTTWPGRGENVQDGTSFATPFVAATAALILQRFPGSTPDAVADRLTATADPAPGGPGDAGYGAGLLNPYRALTEVVTPAAGGRPAAAVRPSADPSLVALENRRAHARTASLIVAAVGAGLVAVLVLAALILRRGRRRGWRPA